MSFIPIPVTRSFCFDSCAVFVEADFLGMSLSRSDHPSAQRRSAPAPTRPGLARGAPSFGSRASPTCVGGGLGRGVVVVSRNVSANTYPHPQPLPSRLRACPLPATRRPTPASRGWLGRGVDTELMATFVRRAIAPSSKRVKSSPSEPVRMIFEQNFARGSLGRPMTTEEPRIRPRIQRPGLGSQDWKAIR